MHIKNVTKKHVLHDKHPGKETSRQHASKLYTNVQQTFFKADVLGGSAKLMH